MMNVFRQMSSATRSPSQEKVRALAEIRERILHTIMIGVLLLAIPVMGIAIYHTILEQKTYLAILYVGLYGIVLLMTVVRKLPYVLRANVLLALFFLLAISEMSESGQMGEVRMILIVFITLTAVFFQGTRVLLNVLISLATIIGTGLYLGTHPINPFPLFAHIQPGTDWVTSSMMFFMLCMIVYGAITMILEGLTSTMQKQTELTSHLEMERNQLEERIHERTENISRRALQLHTAAEISHAISTLTDPETLLPQVVDLLKDRFHLYYVGVFLIDANHQNAVLQAGTGEAGRIMLDQNHHLLLTGNSMIGWCITNRKARIALDTGVEAVRFSNPNLPMTRSELAIPIIAREHVLGAATIQSDEPNAFDENDISVLQSVCESLAIALENDRLFKETRQRLDEIRVLNREYLQQGWSNTAATMGELAFEYQDEQSIRRGTNAHQFEVPLTLRDEVIGIITLDMEQSEFSAEDRAFVDNVANQTAIALENARLLHETEQRALQEQKLNQLTNRFSRALSVDEILRSAAQELGQFPSVAQVTVQLTPIMPSNLTDDNPPRNGNGKKMERAQ